MKKKIDIFWYWFLVIVSFVICFMFSSAINAKAGTLLGNVTYNEGQILVDSSTGTTLEVRKGTTKYYIICNTSTKTIIYHDCTWSDTEGLICNKYISTKTNGDMETSSGTYTYTFLGFGGQGLVMNNKYYLIQNTSSGYTEEDLNAKYQEGFEDGKNSVDITTDNESEYNRGFEDGKNSVDITTDNETYAEQVIQEKLENQELFTYDTVLEIYNISYDTFLKWEEYVKYIDENLFNIVDGELGNPVGDGTPENFLNYYKSLTTPAFDDFKNNYGNQKYTEGQNSVDITTDNEAYAEQVIENKLKNHQLFDPEYVFDLIVSLEQQFYAEGFEDGKNSVDITSNDEQVIQDYITNNNYHTNTDYLNYGNQKYTEGQNSIDITSNDQQAINDYITLNKMKTEEQYLNYGSEQRREGYFASYNNFITAYDQVYSSNNYMTSIGYICETYTSGAYSCSEAYKGYLNDLNNVAVNSVDITSNDDEVYNNGINEGYNYLLNSIIGSFNNNGYESTGNYIEQEKILMNEENINIFDGFSNVDLINQYAILESMLKVEDVGYVKALNDSDAFLGLIPTTLGAVVSNMMPILTYEVYGISLMNIIGLISIIGVAIIVVKFMVG